MNIAQQWGLPPEFAPVRYAVSDDAKQALRGVLQPGEPVIITLANEGDTIALIGTPLRLLVVKTAMMGAGATGRAVREFPWEGLQDIRLNKASMNVKFVLQYRTSDGRKVEVGRRALMGKPAVENLMPFEKVAGEEAFQAMLKVWNWRREQMNEPESLL